ncbi:MAG: hypothetical protein JWM78_2786 [Verrucomicrobiaceae bacterium]|nr:hypothetical protein [Verrucomicrobiaceae bacterium]
MKILSKILVFVGDAAIILVVLGFAFLAYQMGATGEKINSASKKDTEFVLNWGGVNNSQNYKVINSYQSSKTFLRDHLDHYCLQLDSFNPNSQEASNWVFGPEENSLISDARKLLASSGDAAQCFNEPVSGIEQDIAAYIWAVRIHGRNVSGAQIIFYHKKTNRLLYVSLET